MKETVFFVEDDTTIHSLLKATLELNGYQVQGFRFPSDYLEALKTCIPDLLVLDLMLPEMSGYEILDYMKKDERYADIPVIIVSALSDEIDVVRGLDNGAVDYISKPFGMIEFMSRVRSNLRKVRPHNEKNTIIGVRGLVIDKAKFLCMVDGQPVALTAKEFELLTELVENKTRVVSRADLLRKIWGFDSDIETRTLDMHIKTLREKLARVSSQQYIKTVRSIGYVISDGE